MYDSASVHRHLLLMHIITILGREERSAKNK
jgi:hypothetical protein